MFRASLSKQAKLGGEDFSRIFKGSPIKRAKRRGFLRNVVVAMGNSKEKEYIPILEELLNDEEPLVRAHAVWALWKLHGSKSLETLRDHLNQENDEMVKEELEYIFKHT